jgi:hypothetical protein
MSIKIYDDSNVARQPRQFTVVNSIQVAYRAVSIAVLVNYTTGTGSTSYFVGLTRVQRTLAGTVLF